PSNGRKYRHAPSIVVARNLVHPGDASPNCKMGSTRSEIMPECSIPFDFVPGQFCQYRTTLVQRALVVPIPEAILILHFMGYCRFQKHCRRNLLLTHTLANSEDLTIGFCPVVILADEVTQVLDREIDGDFSRLLEAENNLGLQLRMQKQTIL